MRVWHFSLISQPDASRFLMLKSKGRPISDLVIYSHLFRTKLLAFHAYKVNESVEATRSYPSRRLKVKERRYEAHCDPPSSSEPCHG